MAMSKMRREVEFLEPPGEEFTCPVCLDILQEPHLTTCCGNHYICKVCMEKVQTITKTCPLCKATPFVGFINKYFERQLHELKVYCINKKEGCQWIGGYGKIEKHLNIGENDGECKFLNALFLGNAKNSFTERIWQIRDESNHCEYRQGPCTYCNFVSSYQEVMNSHANGCTKYPVLCPNNCSNQTYPRDELNNHLATCPEQEVYCIFNEMGCKEKMKRQHLQHHLKTNQLQHQLIMNHLKR